MIYDALVQYRAIRLFLLANCTRSSLKLYSQTLKATTGQKKVSFFVWEQLHVNAKPTL